MLGVSLSYGCLISDNGGYGMPIADFLSALKQKGVGSIELRAVPSGENPERVLKAAQCVWNAGMDITVHGTLRSGEDIAERVLEPLKQVMSVMKQERLNVTVHPFEGDVVAPLRTLLEASDGYPVQYALENNRKSPNPEKPDCAVYAEEIVSEINHPMLGICFDMGHYAFNHKTMPELVPALPSEAFLKRVFHTHIHALSEQNQTHFPLFAHELPLSDYLAALLPTYRGICNLELEPRRWTDRYEAGEAILLSIDTLKDTLSKLAH